MSKEREIEDEEEKKVAKIAEDVGKKQADYEQSMAKAEPALKAIKDALATLNKGNLTEVKSIGKPPPALTNITAAVIVLLAPAKTVPKEKERGWNQAKAMLGKVG